MARRASRFGLLFMGVFFGILAGILLAYWFNRTGLDFSRVYNYFSDQPEKRASMNLVSTDEIEFAKSKQPSRYLHHKIDSLSSDTAQLSLDEFLAIYGDEYPDTVLINAYLLSSENRARDVVVVKDELLYIRQVKVEGLAEDSHNRDLDSLLLDDRGLKHTNNTLAQVEFWKSPINFRGYKWDTRKLILFGFYDFNYVYIKYLNDQYFMQCGTLFYLLEQSDDFHSLSLVTDDEIIEQLNRL
jgi:hypothetical protein